MKPRFQDQVVLISGAAQGIGLASARLFATEGARLALLDMNAAALNEAASQCQALGAAVICQTGSVAERPVWDALVGAALAQWGRIDVLINNAGITRDARFEKMSEAQFDSVIDINLRGVFHGAQAVLAAMTAAKRG